MARWWHPFARTCAYCRKRLRADGRGHASYCPFIEDLRRAYRGQGK